MQKHKWHKEIKAWADGAEIQFRNYGKDDWIEIESPNWTTMFGEYRIKPQPKKPKYIKIYGYLENQNISFEKTIGMPYIGKIKLEVDNDTSGT